MDSNIVELQAIVVGLSDRVAKLEKRVNELWQLKEEAEDLGEEEL